LNTGALGNLGTVQLSSGAHAPIAGVFSPDGTIFFTSTSGDNLIHMLNTTTLTDTQTLDPKLTNGTGTSVPAQFLAVKSRSTT
jgi:WD40 repeat protein